jgi:hypothetical protein
MITTASSGGLSGIAPAEQPGSESPSGAAGQAGDAFAGVLAGIGESSSRDGRQASAHEHAGGRTADPADLRSEAHLPAELAGADLAMLAMLGPALPASTDALISSGSTAAAEFAKAESGAGTVAPVGDAGPVGASAAVTGPAEQAAAPAQQAAAARPMQAVTAQAAAAAAKAARMADAGVPGPETPVPGPETPVPGPQVPVPGPVTGTDAAHSHGPVNALGPSKAADPAMAAASAPIFELARATQATAAADPVTGTAGTPSGAPHSTSPVPATVTVPAGATQLTGTPVPAVVTLPGAATATATAIATTAIATTAIATTAGAAEPADTKPARAKQASAEPAGAEAVDAAATDARRASGSADGSATGMLSGTHALHHRSARGPGASDEVPRDQPAMSGKVAETAPVSTGVPAEPAAVTAPGGNPAAPAGNPSVSAVHAPAVAPLAAGQSSLLGSEPAYRHPAAELPLARQVAGPVLALRARGDGSHQLIVALHPAELGPVNVHVRIEGNLMTIQLASTSETAHDALREALPQLRSELQSSGLSSASVSVDLTAGGSAGSGGSGAFASPRQGAAEPGRPAGAVSIADPVPAAPRHRGTGGRSSTHSSAGLDRWL